VVAHQRLACPIGSGFWESASNEKGGARFLGIFRREMEHVKIAIWVRLDVSGNVAVVGMVEGVEYLYARFSGRFALWRDWACSVRVG